MVFVGVGLFVCVFVWFSVWLVAFFVFVRSGSPVLRFDCFGGGVGRVPFLRFVSRVWFGLVVCLLDLCVARRGRVGVCVGS